MFILPDFVVLEGFLVAKIFVAGLKRTPRKVTRENLINAIDSMHKLDSGSMKSSVITRTITRHFIASVRRRLKTDTLQTLNKTGLYLF